MWCFSRRTSPTGSPLTAAVSSIVFTRGKQMPLDEAIAYAFEEP